MSSKIITDLSISSNHIGLILLDCPAYGMNVAEYMAFMAQIVAEDGDLGCIPDQVFQFSHSGPGELPLMWTLDNYGRKK